MTKMTAPWGGTVAVPDGRVEHYKALGFTEAKKPAKKPEAKKADA